MANQITKRFCKHSLNCSYAYCIKQDCSHQNRWLCVQCYLEKTHDHMDYVLPLYSFVSRLKQSIENFNQSRMIEIVNTVEQLQKVEISLEFDFLTLKHIVEDTKNTHFILQQINDQSNLFNKSNESIEFLSLFIQNHRKWHSYFQQIKQSIFLDTQKNYFKSTLYQRLNVLLRSPNQFYIKWNLIHHKQDTKHVVISPNQKFLASIQKNNLSLFCYQKQFRKIKSIPQFEIIQFNPQSNQLCAGLVDGYISIINISDFRIKDIKKVVIENINEIVYCSQNQIFIQSSHLIVKYDTIFQMVIMEIQGYNLGMYYNNLSQQLITFQENIVHYRDSETGYLINTQYIDDDLYLQEMKVMVKLQQSMTKNRLLNATFIPRQKEILQNQSSYWAVYRTMFALNQNILLQVNSKEVILLFSSNFCRIKSIKQINNLSKHWHVLKVSSQQYESQTLIIQNCGIKYILNQINVDYLS